MLCCESPEEGGLITTDDHDPLTTLSGIISVYDTSSITINWEGNEDAILFRYNLKSLNYDDSTNQYADWTVWDKTKSAMFIYIDDGFYDFNIQSRFTTDIVETPVLYTFEVDAVQDSSLRIYPLYQEVQADSVCHFYLYAEGMVDLAGMELNISYDPSLLTFNSLTPGDALSNSEIFLNEINHSTGIINIQALAENFGVINGTAVLVKITLTANQIALESPILINGAILKNSNNSEIELLDTIDGIIQVVQ